MNVIWNIVSFLRNNSIRKVVVKVEEENECKNTKGV